MKQFKILSAMKRFANKRSTNWKDLTKARFIQNVQNQDKEKMHVIKIKNGMEQGDMLRHKYFHNQLICDRINCKKLGLLMKCFNMYLVLLNDSPMSFWDILKADTTIILQDIVVVTNHYSNYKISHLKPQNFMFTLLISFENCKIKRLIEYCILFYPRAY